jgi:hypothetical protein
MTSTKSKPSSFQSDLEAEDSSQAFSIPLLVRFDWSRHAAEILWNGTETSPPISVRAQGIPLFDLDQLPPGDWKPLAEEVISKLETLLQSSTSILTSVIENKPDATILILEEGMAHKPSIILNWSAADILKSWACLTPEQKAILLEERYHEMVTAASQSGDKAPPPLQSPHSIFDEFAGIFHAFSSLERNALQSLKEGREKQAIYLLFGRKYDSLHRLLDRILDEEKNLDSVNRYVMLLCAQQVVAGIREYIRNHDNDFGFRRKTEINDLENRLDSIKTLRNEFSFGKSPEDRAKFLDWFEEWFLCRAKPQEVNA